jgi:ribosomal protein L13E
VRSSSLFAKGTISRRLIWLLERLKPWTVEYWKKLYEAMALSTLKSTPIFLPLSRVRKRWLKLIRCVTSGRVAMGGRVRRGFSIGDSGAAGMPSRAVSEGLEDETLLDEDGNTLNP